MKLLYTKYGLMKTSINIIEPLGKGKTPTITLLGKEHNFISPMTQKRFLYFKELFDNFLIFEAENGLFKKFNKKIDENANVKTEVINYLECNFEKYLNKNSDIINADINSLSFMEEIEALAIKYNLNRN